MGILNKFKSIFKKSLGRRRRPTGPRLVKGEEGPKKPEKAKPLIAKTVEAKKVAPKKRDLRELYKIIREPHVSEKSTQLTDKGKYTFKVYARANKIEIAKAVSNLYGVKVRDVKVINIKPKKRVLRGIKGKKPGYRKAIVTLAKGEKIEILPH